QGTILPGEADSNLVRIAGHSPEWLRHQASGGARRGQALRSSGSETGMPVLRGGFGFGLQGRLDFAERGAQGQHQLGAGHLALLEFELKAKGLGLRLVAEAE